MSYIVPREKPHYCIDCIFLDRNYRDCKLQKVDYCDFNKQYKNCPLIELHPHGRLIDADKFKADYSMKNDCTECEKELRGSSRSCEYDRIYSKMDFCGWLDDAEVVIEAEGSKDEHR